MGKLWQKDYKLDEAMERFTVGEDYILDRNLVAADCVASIAQAAMLESINILTRQEFESLKRELVHIIELNQKGEFSIRISDEDCHTAIENHLTGALGEAGKKIHTGRSRNDQVIAALRLYARSFLLEFQGCLMRLAGDLIGFAKKHQDVPMPGRTHMQIAMPSSLGLWAGAYAEELLDDHTLVSTAYDLNNRSPLGSAAGYGVPLPINRQMVSEALGFRSVQNNVLYVNNSRGKIESIILDALEQVMLTLSKLAQDLILFSMPEFQYFTLPAELCTGSSLMPQKRNPAGLELIRAKASSVAASTLQVKGIIRALPSGYNRDFQETKPAFIRALKDSLVSVQVMDLIINRLNVNKEKLLAGFTPEIYATDRALELVQSGLPFREAYLEVALNLDKLENLDPHEAIQKKTHAGATGNLGLDPAGKRVEELKGMLEEEARRVEKKITGLTGYNILLFKCC